ncbi:Gfo/Idh/MocA family protein [Labrys monachus]|uniref:Dehydrogenase n=1 Tax=Labrys monachus TaxID=217067 RepID=A0ABU0FH55_9HYPH|nr:Gfo/Idh/MocA family oxidoreductase [Labrys monachus]MDQ0393905.1 putative dehydrogenase [Labrys monachus]
MSMSFDPAVLRQSWPMPAEARPIVTVGAGSIVADAHFPAYRKAGFPIAGLFDLDPARAERVAADFGVERVFGSLDEATAVPDAVFDLATPPGAHLDVLRRLPDGAAVLLQKPMGRDLAEATAILQLARAKGLKAAVNFQLRFSPMMLAVQDAVARGLLGRLVDVEVHLAIDTPWHLFAFLKGMPRVEIAVHSIHYLDLIRSFLGDPAGVHAKTIGHPASEMAQTRTSAILDYGDDVRCTLSINHNHAFGRRNQVAEFRFDGTEGAAHVKLGLLLDYPRGEPDEVWLRPKGEADWVQVPLTGGWFPDAFVGRMANLQRFASGEDAELAASLEDAWSTMALVEAAFASSAAPATPLAPRP